MEIRSFAWIPKKQYGKHLVDYAKSYGIPIKTNPRMNSKEFFKKMGFVSVSYEMDRDKGEDPLVWYPPGVSEQKH